MKDSISWTSIKSLLRLELRARFGSKAELTKKNAAMKAVNVVFTLAIYAVLVAGIYFLTEMFVERSGMRFEFLVLATVFTMGIATLVAIGNVVKNLYMSGDNELLLRFPVSGTEILIAKSIYCFLHNLVINALLMLPFYIIFGVVTGASAGYYFAALGVMLLAVLLPYVVANLLAIPVMMLMNLVKNQFLLVLILLIGVICAGFILYMTALSKVLVYMQDNEANLFSPEMVAKFGAFANAAYPFKWYAMLLNGKATAGFTGLDLGLAFVYIFLMTGVLGVAAYFVTTRSYYKTILRGIETEKVSFHKVTPNVRRSVFGTLLHREFFLILRSFNYSFQYLAMAVAAPVMVYYCNDLASTMGKDTVGGAIVPGLTLLVIIIFVAIIVSFASTSISREGNAFYHTKIIPVTYTQQILTKLFLYAVVATGSVALSCIVVACAFGIGDNALLTSMDIGCIFVIAEMTVLSLTCLAIWADVKSPTFNVVGDGELVSANKNVALSLLVGILIAVAYGVFSMIFSFIPLQIGSWVVVDSVGDIYAILAIVSVLILGASAAMLFVKLEKRYQKIAP